MFHKLYYVRSQSSVYKFVSFYSIGKDCYISLCVALRAMRSTKSLTPIQKWVKESKVGNSFDKIRLVKVFVAGVFTQIQLTGMNTLAVVGGEFLVLVKAGFRLNKSNTSTSGSGKEGGELGGKEDDMVYALYCDLLEFLLIAKTKKPSTVSTNLVNSQMSVAGTKSQQVGGARMSIRKAKKGAETSPLITSQPQGDGGQVGKEIEICRGRSSVNSINSSSKSIRSNSSCSSTSGNDLMEVEDADDDDDDDEDGDRGDDRGGMGVSMLSRFNIFITTDVMEGMLRIHTAITVLEHPHSWLARLITEPGTMRDKLIPSIIDDELSQLMNFVNDSTGENDGAKLGWYQCKNGHPYSIGSCTMPMQTALCPHEGCGETIGGTNHVLTKGNERFEEGIANKRSQRGYNLTSTSTKKSYDIGRLGKLTTCVLRYLMHTSLLLAAEMEISRGNSDINDPSRVNHPVSGVAALLYPRSNRPPSVGRIIKELTYRLRMDWEVIKEMSSLDDQDVAMGMHMLLFRWGTVPSLQAHETPNERFVDWLNTYLFCTLFYTLHNLVVVIFIYEFLYLDCFHKLFISSILTNYFDDLYYFRM